jgi:hypothetical protein
MNIYARDRRQIDVTLKICHSHFFKARAPPRARNRRGYQLRHQWRRRENQTDEENAQSRYPSNVCVQRVVRSMGVFV